MQKGLLDQTTSEQIQSYYQVNKKKEKKSRYDMIHTQKKGIKC